MFDFDRFRSLKSKGFTPDIVLDIGAYHGHWTSQMKHIYESAEFHLFEAIDYKELSIFSNVYIALLSDTVGKTVDWFEMRNTGDSMFREKTQWFADCAVIKRTTTTLDFLSNTFILEKNKRILMKIDCQGAEIDILKGAANVLKQTDFIVMELPLFTQYNAGVPGFLEHIQFMDSIGFIPYDVLEHHRCHDFTIQVDILFISKAHELNRIAQEQISA